jgi:predicted PurR-regulated permease PerM
LLIYVGVQQLESNVVIPLFQRWAVRLPPAITLLSVVIGGILLGAPGVVFATPLAVVVMTLVKHLYVEDMLEHHRRKPA